MKQKEVPEMDDVAEIISKISEESPYKRRPTQKRTWMTVTEMGKLLGLKKTDRYWLVHKNVFESKEIAGKIRINIASFEKWYANQIKYHKVTGEKPGKELKSWSYSCLLYTSIPPAGSSRISISAVPSDIRNSAVNTFRWNQQTSETSVIERVWGNPHQDKSHRRTGWQTTLLLNMGGSCSYLYPSI